MEKPTYKFISRDEIENFHEPIVLVTTTSTIESLACNVIGDRELTDIELNRIAHFMSYEDCQWSALDMYLISLIGEALKIPDEDWKDVDDEFKARQETLLEVK